MSVMQPMTNVVGEYSIFGCYPYNDIGRSKNMTFNRTFMEMDLLSKLFHMPLLLT